MSGPRLSRHPTGPWAILAETLTQRRRALGMTQKQAADLSDLSEKALRDIESGKVAPRLGALVAVAEALALDLTLSPRSTRNQLPTSAVIIRRDRALDG